MRNSHRLTAGIALCAVATVAWGADAPLVYRCFRAAASPSLDGVIAGDLGWENIPGATGYHRLGGGYALAKQTTAYLTWDDEHLYIGIVAEEPDIAGINATMTDGDDCWLEDSVEIFIQPEGRGPYQLIVTCAGARSMGEGNLGLEGWDAEASRAQDTYSIEVRISFALLGVVPTAASVWHANYCRNIFTYESGGIKFTTWAPLVSRFLEPEHFPELRFLDKAISEVSARQFEDALNADYRATLMTQVAELATAAAEYIPFLTEAARDSKHRRQALSLRREWRSIARLHRDAAQTPVLEVREVLKNASRLKEMSYQFKYGKLIEELFEE